MTDPIIPNEVRIVEPGRGPSYDRERTYGAEIAAHLSQVWGWLPDDPEALELGQRAASALAHAFAGSRTSPESLVSAILCIPSGQAPVEVYARAVTDVRAALIAADPTVSDTVLASIDIPNPYPEYRR